MWEAAFWGFVGGFALLLGAVAGIWLPTSRRFVGLIMAFGTGVLFSAVAFELTTEAYDRSGADAVVYGLLAGSVVFFAGDWLIDRHGGHRRKSPNGSPADAGHIPESLSASTGMRRDGRSATYILGLWTAVLVASTIAAALGFGLLGSAPVIVIAVTQAFAAGRSSPCSPTRWSPRRSSTRAPWSAW